MFDNYMPEPADFEDAQFAQNNKALFDEYIELVVRGEDTVIAFALSFGIDVIGGQSTRLFTLAIQRNPYYKSAYAKRVKSISIDELWSSKTAVISLLKMVKEAGVSDTAKLNAIKELNVIYGITMIDDKGNTKLGRSMDDFYKDFTGGRGESDLYPNDKPTSH